MFKCKSPEGFIRFASQVQAFSSKVVKSKPVIVRGARFSYILRLLSSFGGE
jgi:hypothetical protein